MNVGKLRLEELANQDVVPFLIVVLRSLARHGAKYGVGDMSVQ